MDVGNLEVLDPKAIADMWKPSEVRNYEPLSCTSITQVQLVAGYCWRVCVYKLGVVMLPVARLSGCVQDGAAAADDGWDENKHGNAKIAQAVASGQGTGHTKYLTTNLALFDETAAAELLQLREHVPYTVLPATRGITDVVRIAVVLLGGIGKWTRLHMDWAAAWNLAVALLGCDLTLPLAVWVFIAPWAVAMANEWLKKRKGKKGSKGNFHLGLGLAGNDIFLGDEDVRALEAHLNAQCGPRRSLVVLEQKAGDLVRVPPGWVHQVVNKQRCLKIAGEVYDEADFARYGLHMQAIASPIFGPQMFPDYTALSRVVDQALGVVTIDNM